ncbi:phosphatidate cytidylyltransferase [Geomonas sp. RF6]|nr:phosphatidate cytidylyltransferase [Geomonas sp. RF6]
MPLLILFILKSPPVWFDILIAVVAAIGLDEFYRMTLPERRSEGWSAAVVGALALFTIPFADGMLSLFALTAAVLGFSLVGLFRLKDIAQAASESAFIFMGFLYVPLLLAHLILLRVEPHGVAWIFLMMVIVMSGDSAAYYVGSSFGRTKLYPAVSPKKSVEGSLGGLAGSVIGALVFRALFFAELTIVDAVAVALLCGVLGQLGDLFESLIKRSCGVKDSGTLIPGHGGILDRLDSILFAAPAVFYYAYFVFAG